MILHQINIFTNPQCFLSFKFQLRLFNVKFELLKKERKNLKLNGIITQLIKGVIFRSFFFYLTY